MQGNQDWEKGREERERLEEEKLEEEEERLEKWLKKEKKKTDYIVVGPISKDFYKDTGAFCSLGRGQISVLFQCEDFVCVIPGRQGAPRTEAKWEEEERRLGTIKASFRIVGNCYSSSCYHLCSLIGQFYCEGRFLRLFALFQGSPHVRTKNQQDCFSL